MTATTVTRTAALDRDAAHRAALEKIRSDRDAKLRDERQRLDARIQAFDEDRRRQRELDIEKQLAADAIEIERQRLAIQYRRHLGLPDAARELSFAEMDQRVTTGAEAHNPHVVKLRAFVRATAATAKIDVRVSRLPQTQNASAVRSLKRVDVPPVIDFETAATNLHELGHILGEPEPEGSPSKPGEFGIGRICVAAEIRAWRWALDRSPVWNRRMHDAMTAALSTYRRHATPAEALEIDELCSSKTYSAARLRAAMEG